MALYNAKPATQKHDKHSVLIKTETDSLLQSSITNGDGVLARSEGRNTRMDEHLAYPS